MSAMTEQERRMREEQVRRAEERAAASGKPFTMGDLMAVWAYGPCHPGMKLIYVDGCGLNCRRENLRYVPESEEWPEPEFVAVMGDEPGEEFPPGRPVSELTAEAKEILRAHKPEALTEG